MMQEVDKKVKFPDSGTWPTLGGDVNSPEWLLELCPLISPRLRVSQRDGQDGRIVGLVVGPSYASRSLPQGVIERRLWRLSYEP